MLPRVVLLLALAAAPAAALALLAGDSLNEYAGRAGLGRNTVKTQLGALFGKIGDAAPERADPPAVPARGRLLT